MTTIDNTPAVIEWRVKQGDDWSLPLVKNDSPVSMAGWTFLAQIRVSALSTSTLIASFTVVTTDASTGTVYFRLLPATTSTIAAGTYWYEIQNTNGGVITTMFCGPLIVEGDTAVAV